MLTLISIDCVGSGAGKFLTGSTAGHLRLWAVDSVELLRQPRQASQPPVTAGLTMEDEMTLDGGVVSAHFDENLEMVSGCGHCGMLVLWGEKSCYATKPKWLKNKNKKAKESSC